MSSTLTTDLSSHLALVTGATGGMFFFALYMSVNLLSRVVAHSFSIPHTLSGIGRATCLSLAKLGCSVAIHYHSAAEKAAKLESTLMAYGVKAQAFQADLSDYEGARKLHAAVVKDMGHPTILFNNAGMTMGKSGVKDISEVTVEEFEQTWRGNCGTAFLLTQLCIPSMLRHNWGRVIFCSSVAGFTGGVVGPHYAYVCFPFPLPCLIMNSIIRYFDRRKLANPYHNTDHQSRQCMVSSIGSPVRMGKKASP